MALRRAMDAPLHLLDHDRLGAAVREALAHDALLDRTLQRKRLGRRHAQSLVTGVIAVIHVVHASQGLGRSCPSALKPCSKALSLVNSIPAEAATISSSPRYTANRRAEARKAFAAGPDPARHEPHLPRPSAESSWSMAKVPIFRPSLRRRIAAARPGPACACRPRRRLGVDRAALIAPDAIAELDLGEAGR